MASQVAVTNDEGSLQLIIEVYLGVTETSILSEFKAKLPLETPLGDVLNWNGALDSFAGGIVDAAHDVVLVWKDAHAMIEHNPELYSQTVSVLRDVCERLKFEEKMGRSSQSFVAVIVGPVL